jgi:hypothetical protein
MSGMNPVVLVVLPNANYMLGTFDTIKFRQWWRSAPFPVDVETIKRGFHIYGRTHLAIAELTDGSWVLLRSKDYGINWDVAWIAAEGEVIYDLVLITYGRAIMNTSLGFYETVDSGVEWSKISDLPGASSAPAFCNIGGGDVLMCTDGRYIWRSTDIARHWAQVCDLHTVDHCKSIDAANIHYTNLSQPAIAGACGRVFAASGPFLVVSEGSGSPGSWHYHPSWEHYPSARDAAYWPPKSLVYDRLWSGSSPRSPPRFVISQILISSVDGPTGDDVCFLFRADDLYPLSGETQLYSRIFKTYSDTLNGVYRGNYFFKNMYQQYLSPSEGQQLSSYDVAVLGASYNDKLVFSAQTKTVDGVAVPSLKYSNDGGASFIDIDISSIKIGDPDIGGYGGGSMLDDNFAKLTWVAPACNNWGSYDVVELYRRQCQSYEFDANIEIQKPITESREYKLDSNLSEDHTKTYQTDAIVELEGSKPYQLASYNEGLRPKAYRIDRTLEGVSEESDDLDVIVSQDTPIADEMDAVISGRPKRYYRLTAYLQDRMPRSYLLDCIIERYQLNKRLARIGDEFPQVFDLDLPRGGDEA